MQKSQHYFYADSGKGYCVNYLRIQTGNINAAAKLSNITKHSRSSQIVLLKSEHRANTEKLRSGDEAAKFIITQRERKEKKDFCDL